MNLINKIRQSLRSSNSNQGAVLVSAGMSLELNADRAMRIEIFPALNGRIVQVGTYKPNPHGPDWTWDMYIVPEGESLVDALSVLLALKMP